MEGNRPIGPPGLAGDIGRERPEIRRVTLHPTAGIGPGESQQVIDQTAEALALRHDVSQSLGPIGVGGVRMVDEEPGVVADRGQWCPKLVRGIGDKSSLRGEGFSEASLRVREPLEHAVEARREHPDLVACSDRRQSAREVAGPPDLVGRCGQCPQWRERAPDDEPADKSHGNDGHEGREREEEAEPRDLLRHERDRLTGDDHTGCVGSRPAHRMDPELGVRRGSDHG